MTEKKLETKSAIDKYYQKKLILSYSALSKFLFSPAAYFKRYVLEIEDDKPEAYMIEGKVIHALLLEGSTFNDQFVISPTKLPGENTKKVIDEMFNIYMSSAKAGLTPSKSLANYSKEICELLIQMSLHQSLKTDKQRIDKIITEEGLNYWNFLISTENKMIIDLDIYNRCKESVDILTKDPEISDLLGLYKTEMDNIEVFNELYLNGPFDPELDLVNIEIKGIIDNLKINHDEKVIFINDLKKTSKTIPEFKESIEYYNYWIQATFYHILVDHKYADLIKKGYTVKFNFIVVDRFQQTYVFEVSKETLVTWGMRTLEKLKEFMWHYDHKKFDLPYEYASKKVIL